MSTSSASQSTPYESISPFIIVSGALVFVVGLAWNEAIQSGIEEFGPQETGTQFKAKLIYATIITIIGVGVIYFMEFAKSKIGGHHH
jgi:Family of unknown function (DUF5654)